MKILPVGVEVFQADGQTDIVKLVFAFHNFENAPKKAPQILRNIKFHITSFESQKRSLMLLLD